MMTNTGKLFFKNIYYFLYIIFSIFIFYSFKSLLRKKQSQLHNIFSLNLEFNFILFSKMRSNIRTFYTIQIDLFLICLFYFYIIRLLCSFNYL